MTNEEKRIFLIQELLSEQPKYSGISTIPTDTAEQKKMLRSLLNVRLPITVNDEFLSVQDEYLKEETAARGITELNCLTPVRNDLYLWQGDITLLACDAIVNAANSGMLGCFQPCHGCIDNAIHTYAGIQLRLACAELMREQGYDEPTGNTKITSAYNLPSKYVIHTVGPIVYDRLTETECDRLASCYRSCISLADKNGLNSIALCCISTGVFRFPNDKAAEIAVKTIAKYKEETNSKIKVIYNVFKNQDYEIYRKLLAENRKAENRT
ncbi:MAG: protein-ADP-ribose hydrolase [Oscillospiraceae bacterium]|nr:protein-ADP-ribose hydrolase [Oscillospiraceae bacterium]